MSNNGFRIQDSNLTESANRDAFIKDMNNFLGPYGDSKQEFEEALDNALERGFVFEIVNDANQRVGGVVITETEFRKFQPRYHLAYIATSEACRGKGCGKTLLAEAQRRTDNDLALHVSPTNVHAIAFYERLGWEIKYTRMMPVK